MLTAIAAALAVTSVSLASSANAGGLAGYSGKPNLAAPAGESCNKCHSGGTAPMVSLTGPSSLAAGTTATYSLVVKTAQSRAAGAIAATDGIVLTPVTNVRDSFGEMVPNGGVAVAGGQATFTFKVTAPLTGTTLKLWAVGLAANGSGTGGDKASQTTMDVAVTGGAPPKLDAGSSSGDASTGPVSDGGAGDGGTSGTGGGSGTSGGDGSVSGSSGASTTSGGAAAEDPASKDPGEGGEGASCSASPTLGDHGASGLALSLLGALALVWMRKRRRNE